MCLCVIIYRIYTWLSITTSDRVPMSERDTHTARERERWCPWENTIYTRVYTLVMLSSALTRSLETLTLMIQVYALPSLSNLILLWKWKWNQRANQHKIIILIFIYLSGSRTSHNYYTFRFRKLISSRYDNLEQTNYIRYVDNITYLRYEREREQFKSNRMRISIKYWKGQNF